MLKLSGAIVAIVLLIVGVFLLGHSLSDSAAPGVFDELTPRALAGAGVTILDTQPTDQPTVAWDMATRSVLDQGVTVESSQLVRINVAPTEAIPPKPSGEFLAWAIRLDTLRRETSSISARACISAVRPTRRSSS